MPTISNGQSQHLEVTYNEWEAVKYGAMMPDWTEPYPALVVCDIQKMNEFSRHCHEGTLPTQYRFPFSQEQRSNLTYNGKAVVKLASVEPTDPDNLPED